MVTTGTSKNWGQVLKDPRLIRCENLEELSHRAAELFVQLAQQAVTKRSRLTVALCGGRTPSRLYAMLGEPTFRQQVPWDQVAIFWGDERCVPPDHSDSNYRMAHELLLSKVPIPEPNIYRMPGEQQDPNVGTKEYAQTLRNVFGLSEGAWPQLDLVLLGLGEDGHTASLFPYTAVLQECTRLVAAPFVKTLNAYRLTLTIPVFNAARHVVFLVSGQSKAAILKEVLQGDTRPEALPAQLIRPNPGELHWLVDRPAASLLGT
ncbi:MAG: 6-phosphogluconolactonase [Elusimicrobia bacterium]|nr:6-phosphogluconolactonase [Elusimicrobiota bacterium]